MQINLLGPLSVSVDGTDATPTAPKTRRVLALLAIHANRVVPNQLLIEELWENQPPPSVTTTLQTYVYQLRKHLNTNPAAVAAPPRGGRPPGEVLRTYAGGYMLCLRPEALDSLRFEQLAQRGRAELDRGETGAASRTLREALALWQGPALVDINPGPLLQVEALRLDEIFKSALELRIDADLRLGRHHELLGELIGLAARQPTHEGFQSKLMLALYRAGRRSEALDAYQRARETLVDELGVDPCDDLQRLHRAILAGDPALNVPGGVSALRPAQRQDTGHRIAREVHWAQARSA
ncbi:AfsR/SARP family transcriptional regulator [Micromonospora okii]|uniref:Transcriptional activator n=1 Tax=Micromonospora okii TaxID=1182970 RepID=A0A023GUM9_9ACTN|nr:AfsR/SARP family transcriptional regulator [Micromonospora okii]AFJ52668.1 transcriptional activator [Micromonospora okii]